MTAIESGDMQSSLAFLEKHNEDYYRDGSSALTDAEFDAVQAAYTSRFGIAFKTGERTLVRSDRHATVEQDWPLLANWLDKAADRAGLDSWRATRAGVEGVEGGWVVSPKWDGCSIVVTYDRAGRVVRALTRGDDGKGVDVTRLLAGENHFGDDFDFGADRFGVKYELVMSWGDLDRMNEELGQSYRNPRNTVAGVMSSDDPTEKRKYVTLVPLDLEWDELEDERLARIGMMAQLFTPDEDEATPAVFTGNTGGTPFFWYECESEADVLAAYDEIHLWRSSPEFGYMIDGVVAEFVSQNDVERLGGRVSDCPAYAIAAKFPAAVGRSKVVSLDWDLGNTGRLTPVVNYEPVTLDGRTFSRTSIANMTRFDQLKLCPGTPILIEIRGDVLAWLDRDGPDPEGVASFPAPSDCEFTFNERNERVFAYVDAPLDGRCERMMVKCGVRGVRIETIFKLVEHGVVGQLADMWQLPAKTAAIAAIPGLGDQSAKILAEAITAKISQGLWDWEILASAGINGVGRTLARTALGVATLDELLDAARKIDESSPARRDMFASLVKTIGPERARILLEGIVREAADIRALCDVALASPGGLHATKELRSDYAGPFYKVVVTGDLKRWERGEFKTMIEQMGHKMVGSISRNVNFLITNTPSSGTVKNKRASELGIEIITEDQAIDRLGIVLEVKQNENYDPAVRVVNLEDV
jgi:DNA ligase (NAD+)